MKSDIADLKGKNVLFIAYFFPPVVSTNVPGAMRTIKFIRNLENGSLHVLTVTPEITEDQSALSHLNTPIKGEIIHTVGTWDIFKVILKFRSFLKHLFRRTKHSSALYDNQPAKPNVFRSNDSSGVKPNLIQKLKDFIYNLCYFPDQEGPWILPAVLTGRKIIKNNKIDVIFATGSPWSGLIVGYLLGKVTGTPVISDFRDPWVNNPFHQSKGPILDRLSRSCERKVVKNSICVSLNTEPLQEDFVKRYSSIPKERFFVMPNGFDPHDFKELLTIQPNHNPNIVTLCHAGFLYGVRDPSVLLEAIQLANEKLKSKGIKIRLVQIGNIQLNYDLCERYEDMLKDKTLIIKKPVPYNQCLRLLTEADWVVNIQPATKSQIPSKLYDYLAIKRPIINITPRDGALGKMVESNKIGELFDFTEKQALSDKLVDIALKHNEGRSFAGYTAREQFDCSEIAKTLSNRIQEVS